MTAADAPWFELAPPPPIWPEGLRRELPCQRDPEAWHPVGGHVPRDVADGCAACPRRVECLGWALEARPSHGVWAGYTGADVRRMADGKPPAGRTQVERAEVAVEDMTAPPCDCVDDAEHFVEDGRRIRCRVLMRAYSRNARANRKARAAEQAAA